MRLRFIINGQEIGADVKGSQLLGTAVMRILHASGTKMTLTECEVRDRDGKTLDVGKTVWRLPIASDDRIYVQPRAGVGA